MGEGAVEPDDGGGGAPLLEGHLRFLIIDGSTQAGSEGHVVSAASGHRHGQLHLLHGVVTDAHEGERLGHYPLQDGDVVVVDRGYNQTQMWIDQADRGVGLGVRYNPHGLHLYDAAGQKIDLEATLKATVETERCRRCGCATKTRNSSKVTCMPAGCRRRSGGGPAPGPGQAKKAGRQIRPRTLALAEWVLIFTTVPPAVLPTATVMALYR